MRLGLARSMGAIDGGSKWDGRSTRFCQRNLKVAVKNVTSTSERRQSRADACASIYPFAAVSFALPLANRNSQAAMPSPMPGMAFLISAPQQTSGRNTRRLAHGAPHAERSRQHRLEMFPGFGQVVWAVPCLSFAAGSLYP